MTDTLGDTLPEEIARVRQVLATYIEIGPPGQFGAMMIEESLRRAEIAVMRGDIVAMIQAYSDLKEIKG